MNGIYPMLKKLGKENINSYRTLDGRTKEDKILTLNQLMISNVYKTYRYVKQIHAGLTT